jgi:folate-dependent phosphoribosylglycinamide formyltransferase PurN
MAESELRQPLNFNDGDQLTAIISELEKYSQSLVKNFEATTKQIRQALADRGAIAAQAVEILAASQAEVDSILNNSFAQLEGIINAVESLLPEFDGLEAVNDELVLLSDILTTVEEAVQRRQ